MIEDWVSVRECHPTSEFDASTAEVTAAPAG
jgi:hypothetical protein